MPACFENSPENGAQGGRGGDRGGGRDVRDNVRLRERHPRFHELRPPVLVPHTGRGERGGVPRELRVTGV